MFKYLARRMERCSTDGAVVKAHKSPSLDRLKKSDIFGFKEKLFV